MSESETSKSAEKDTIIDRVTDLFSDEFPFFISYLNEEITHFAAIADLLKKDADPNIFKNLGLKYGSAVRFKKEFSNTVAVHELNSTPRLKPTMGEMSGFNPEMKSLYLSKHRKVGLLATQHWGVGNFPKFNTPEMKAQLKKFAIDIVPECSIPEIEFTCEGICQHIQNYFNEQCRYRKRNGQQDGQVSDAESLKSESSKSDIESSQPAESCSKPVSQYVKRKTSSTSGSCGKKFRATLEETPPEQDSVAQNFSDSGESLSTLSPYDSSDSIESPRTRIFCIAGSPASEVKVPFTIVSSQVVIKVVFGEVLTRDEAVGIVKSKFSVKQNNLKNLTPSQVMSVLVKKLDKHKYVTLKENVSSLSDVTVHKKIAV
ncbi:unnamed protein product [Pocillopora meandrina]|uniref:Uncharacterized protein n=1 Tax=Pocillopora meandrina TaxID=46732 RepID=A0AAU9XZR0_9CNID|nr:unnamed protein product [Pocillopora meandrina]